MFQEGEFKPADDSGINAGGSVGKLAVEKPVVTYDKSTLIVVAVCVILSTIFLKTGFLSFFFLAPLGYAVLVSGSMKITFIAAAITNIVVSVIQHLFSDNISAFSLWMGILYTSTVFLMFVWIIGGRNIRTVYRFIIASAAGAFAFLGFIWNFGNNEGVNAFFNYFAQVFSSRFNFADNAGQPVMMTENLMEMITGFSIRGVALVSMLFIFFINRQLALTLLLLIKKQRNNGSLTLFFAPANTIWIFAGSLAAIMLTNLIRVNFLEIIAWNVFTVCVIVFLVQGFGILTFLLAKLTPGFKLIASVLFIVAVISPLSLIVIIALFLLGASETWLPLRKPKEKAKIL